jgi:WD40 repeat protein
MPQLCNIKELKANTDAVWNMRGDKFAVGASSGFVFIGTYNEAVGLWIAQAISDKPTHDSPVTKVCFDPLSGKCVASASTDGTVQLNSDFNEEVDSKTGDGPFGNFNEPAQIFKFKCGEWVNSLSFSPSGHELAFATHDSTMHFVSITEADVKSKKKPSGQKFSYPGAPILSGCFVTEDCYVGSGYDKTPLIFKREGGNWKYVDRLDAGAGKVRAQVKTGKDAFSGKNIYFEHPLDNTVHMKETDTKHANYINC